MKWQSGVKEKPPLDGVIASRLRQTHRNPAEWVVTALDGRVIYVVASSTKLLICTGDTLTDALRNAKGEHGTKVPHRGIDPAVTTARMLEVTGIELGEGVTVNDRVPGDLL